MSDAHGPEDSGGRCQAPKVIVILTDGTAYSTIQATPWCFPEYINRWRRRFIAHGLITTVTVMHILCTVPDKDSIRGIVKTVVGLL